MNPKSYLILTYGLSISVLFYFLYAVNFTINALDGLKVDKYCLMIPLFIALFTTTITALLIILFSIKKHIQKEMTPVQVVDVVTAENSELIKAMERCGGSPPTSYQKAVAFQELINIIKITDKSIFKNDSEEIIRLTTKLDKIIGSGNDEIGVYCKVPLPDFQRDANALLQLLRRQSQQN